jgi:hypothetical protein
LLEFEVHHNHFGQDEMFISNLFKPVPAVSMLPEWFKRLATDDDQNQDFPTVKQCRGVWDILASGYYFLWPFDVEIFVNEMGKLDIVKTRNRADRHAFHPHPHSQLEGYNDITLEKQMSGVQKISTPYRVKTPPGTSVLVQQPPYRPELRTTVMPGIIDSDTYYGDFNILFTLNEMSGKRKIKIKSGTPLAHVIPYVRGEWELKFDNIDKEKDEMTQELARDVEKFYQKYLWHRKVFKGERSKESTSGN